MSISDTHGTHICIRLKQYTRHAQMCTRGHTHIYVHLRHTRTCVELERQRVLLVKYTHMCTPGTHICVHLQHAHVFTWNTMKPVPNSDTHVCTRGTHVCSPGTQTRAIKAHMCVHVEHTYVHGANINAHLKRTHTHTCAHLENNHAVSGAHACAHLESKYVVRCKKGSST